MTSWLPDLREATGPIYVRLADQIERDIDSGTLSAGSRLPPQRNLAYDIGVTIGTVSRAYALARERGLVSGEVGRGTFVLDRNTAPTRASPLPATAPMVSGTGPLRFDTTAAPENGVAAMLKQMSAEVCRDRPDAVTTYIRAIPDAWRQAGVRWLAASGWTPARANVVPTQGVHAAVMSVIGATTVPGDKIVFEHLTYASVARSAALIGRRGITVGSDDKGVLPDDFERLCAQQHPKLVFLMPSLQNPTLATLPPDRRQAIVEIARKHQVWIIEDAIYSVLLDNDAPLMAALAPDRVFHVGGLSKAVSAGLRSGWVACPPNFEGRVNTAHKMLTGGKPFLMSEVAARMVNSGAAHEVRRRTLADIARRVAIARETLAGLEVRLNDAVSFLWLTLPEPWLSGTFKNAAAAESILIDDEDEYKVGRSDTAYHGVRVGFSTEPDIERVAAGFRTLRRLVDQGAGAYDSYN